MKGHFRAFVCKFNFKLIHFKARTVPVHALHCENALAHAALRFLPKFVPKFLPKLFRNFFRNCWNLSIFRI